jgi:hypothetical protein
MTATIALEQNSTETQARNWGKVAGFTYVGAWVVGLTVFGVGPASDATDSEIARYFADHRAMSTVQSLLIHGVAALALLGVLAAVKRSGRSIRLAHTAGLVAVSLSLVQCVLDVYRSLISTGTTTATLAHTIDRIDGLKMFAFAVMIAASITVFRNTGLIGKKMVVAGKLAVPALAVSGIAYAAAITSLLASADLSLVLLLVWVGYAGVAAGRASH